MSGGSREREIQRNRSGNRDNRSSNRDNRSGNRDNRSRERYCDQSGKKEPIILSCKKVDPIVE